MLDTRGKALRIMAAVIVVLTVSVSRPHDLIAQQQADDKNPWRIELCIVGDCEDIPEAFTAPNNRNVVIDVFSGECSIENGGVFRQMRAVLDDSTMHLFIPGRSTVGSSHTIYDWNEQTHLVVTARSTFRIAVSTVSNLPDLAYCRFFLSGYTLKP